MGQDARDGRPCTGRRGRGRYTSDRTAGTVRKAQIVRQMVEMHKKYDTSIIMVTHNLGVAAYMSHHIVVI